MLESTLADSCYWQCYLFCRQRCRPLVGLNWRWSVQTGRLWRSLWLRLRCRRSDSRRVRSLVFWDTLQDEGREVQLFRYTRVCFDLMWYFQNLQAVSPCWECGSGTERPGPSWGTPDPASSSRHTHTPPQPKKESCEMHPPRTGEGSESIWGHIVRMNESTVPNQKHSKQSKTKITCEEEETH